MYPSYTHRARTITRREHATENDNDNENENDNESEHEYEHENEHENFFSCSAPFFCASDDSELVLQRAVVRRMLRNSSTTSPTTR
jgi:hypothetical protein